VIGLGNELRGDDGAGLVVARRVRRLTGQGEIEVRELGDEPAALLDAWRDRDAVIIADTMRSGSAPGTILRLDPAREPLPLPRRGRSSTHAVGLQETVELARVLGRLPASLVVYAVEGARFNPGTGLSPAVQAAIPELVQMVVREAAELADRPPE
jgi:hydrogenase maturation protease